MAGDDPVICWIVSLGVWMVGYWVMPMVDLKKSKIKVDVNEWHIVEKKKELMFK